MPERNPAMCPSAMCEPENQLLGIVGRDGKVSFLEKPIRIDDSFVAIARRGRTPEKRFRFTTPCLNRECGQWKGGRCSVGDEAIRALGDGHFGQSHPPDCGIRDSCRWHLQSGTTACSVCPEVITDTTVPHGV